MNWKLLCFCCVLIGLVSSCQSPRWVLTEVKGSSIALDASTELIADSNMEAMILPYKTFLEEEMNVVIGYATHSMRAHKPESTLSNFAADAYRQAASQHLQAPVDLAIVNLGGLRSQIPSGNVTVGNVYELMPFENELVILTLPGEALKSLLDFFASVGGEGVSGLRMNIRQGKATDITIAGKPLQVEKNYLVATNNYLAEGNDGMTYLLQSVKQHNTGIKVRDLLLNHIRALTAQRANITAVTDGRITVVE